MDVPFRLSVITDEIDDDLRQAVAAASEWGLGIIELNDVWGRNITELSDAEIDDAAAIIAEAGVEVVAIDTPCFKTIVLDESTGADVRDQTIFREHLSQLDRGLELARRFDAKLVRMFSFRRPEMVGLGNPSPRLPQGGAIQDAILEQITRGLRAACERAETHGIVLGLENVRSCWGNTGVNTARIIEAVDSPWLHVVWDPANDYVSGGDGYPGGYEAVRDHTVHLQVKDAKVRDAATGLTSWEPMGEGEVDYHGQFSALLRDNYRGVVSLETHWHPPGRPRVDNSRDSLCGLRRILQQCVETARERS